MRSLFFLALLLPLPIFCLELHTRPFFDFPELATPSFTDGKISKQDFVHYHGDGTQTRLRYVVEHTDRFVLRIDELPLVAKVICFEDTLEITFSETMDLNELVSNLSVGTLLAGGAHWKCIDSLGHLSILRQVTGKVKMTENWISIPTAPASHLHFFKEASIEFFTDAYPANHFTQYWAETPSPLLSVEQEEVVINSKPYGEKFATPVNGGSKFNFESSMRTSEKEQLAWSWFQQAASDIWQGIKTVAAKVTNVVNTVIEVAKAIATGNYNYSNQWSGRAWSWNIAANGAIQNPAVNVSNGLICNNCFANSSYSLSFSLGISNYALQNLSLILDGTASYQLGISCYWTGSINLASEVLIATVYMAPISLAVGGIPLVIRASVPVYIGYDVSIDAYTVWSFQTKGSGSIRYGIRYLNSKWDWIEQNSFSQSGGLFQITMNYQIRSIAYILPTAVVQAEYIGGPNLGAKAFFEFLGQYADNDCYQWRGTPFMVDTAWGLELTLGAKIDISFPGNITIYRKEWKPVAIASFKKPLLSGCPYVAYPSDEPIIPKRNVEGTEIIKTHLFPTNSLLNDTAYVYFANDGWVPGTTWTATQRRISSNTSCSSYPPYLQWSIQLLDSVYAPTYTALQFFGSSDYGTTSPDYACTTETLYSSTIYSRTQVYFGVQSSTLDYKNCTDTKAPITARVYQGSANSQWSVLTVYDGSTVAASCVELVLTSNCVYPYCYV